MWSNAIKIWLGFRYLLLILSISNIMRGHHHLDVALSYAWEVAYR